MNSSQIPLKFSLPFAIVVASGFLINTINKVLSPSTHEYTHIIKI